MARTRSDPSGDTTSRTPRDSSSSWTATTGETRRDCGQTFNIPLLRERIGEARDELMRMLAEDELREAVLLIFANKQDLPNAMNAAEITDKLGLHSLRNRNWYIQATCAKSADGLYEGLDWLSNQLKNATR